MGNPHQWGTSSKACAALVLCCAVAGAFAWSDSVPVLTRGGVELEREMMLELNQSPESRDLEIGQKQNMICKACLVTAGQYSDIDAEGLSPIRNIRPPLCEGAKVPEKCHEVVRAILKYLNQHPDITIDQINTAPFRRDLCTVVHKEAKPNETICEAKAWKDGKSCKECKSLMGQWPTFEGDDGPGRNEMRRNRVGLYTLAATMDSWFRSNRGGLQGAGATVADRGLLVRPYTLSDTFGLFSRSYGVCQGLGFCFRPTLEVERMRMVARVLQAQIRVSLSALVGLGEFGLLNLLVTKLEEVEVYLYDSLRSTAEIDPEHDLFSDLETSMDAVATKVGYWLRERTGAKRQAPLKVYLDSELNDGLRCKTVAKIASQKNIGFISFASDEDCQEVLDRVYASVEGVIQAETRAAAGGDGEAPEVAPVDIGEAFAHAAVLVGEAKAETAALLNSVRSPRRLSLASRDDPAVIKRNVARLSKVYGLVREMSSGLVRALQYLVHAFDEATFEASH